MWQDPAERPPIRQWLTQLQGYSMQRVCNSCNTSCAAWVVSTCVTPSLERPPGPFTTLYGVGLQGEILPKSWSPAELGLHNVAKCYLIAYWKTTSQWFHLNPLLRSLPILHNEYRGLTLDKYFTSANKLVAQIPGYIWPTNTYQHNRIMGEHSIY